MVLLQEATTEQFFEELDKRYPDHIFAGVSAVQRDDYGFEFKQKGAYIMQRGLYAIIGEHLGHEARSNFEEWENREEE